MTYPKVWACVTQDASGNIKDVEFFNCAPSFNVSEEVTGGNRMTVHEGYVNGGDSVVTQDSHS